MRLYFQILFLGFLFLVVGGEFLVRSSVGLSYKLKLSKMVIGLTVVSFATSAPELIVSLKAALDGFSDISLGNVIGSNIANIGLVLGITAIISPLAIDKDGIDKKIVDKELEIIKAEITNSGKPAEMAEKISKGKIEKFLNDNSLLNQIWIMDPKKKVSDVLKENSGEKKIKILDFVRYKVGEGV